MPIDQVNENKIGDDRAASTLEQECRFLQEALDAAEIGSWYWDFTTLHIRGDARICRFYGLSPEEALDGPEEAWMERVHPDDRARILAALDYSIQTGERYEATYRVPLPEGGDRWLNVRGNAVLNAEGVPVGVRGIAMGVTDRVETERALRARIEEQRRAEQNQRFLAELSERIRPLANPADVLWYVVNALGEHLQVTHCTYAEIDEERNRFISHPNYHITGRSTAGAYSLDIFGEVFLTLLRCGQTMVVEDTRRDRRTAQQYEIAYRRDNTRAFIVVPLIKEGRWIATLSVTMHGKTRAWTADEVELVEKVMEFTWLATENLRLYLAEREKSEQLALAISEIHHRVKNNLQAVGALLDIQIPEDGEMMPVEAVRDSLGQIRTIAMVHDLLSKDNPIGMVDAAAVLTNLARLLSPGLRAGGRAVSIQVEAVPHQMETRLATSLALVVNELLTNAAKHSGDGERAVAVISVTMGRRGEDIRVVVCDEGPGFPPGFDPIENANIGLEVVQTLVGHDLGGRVLFRNRSEQTGGREHGGLVEIIFPAAH